MPTGLSPQVASRAGAACWSTSQSWDSSAHPTEQWPGYPCEVSPRVRRGLGCRNDRCVGRLPTHATPSTRRRHEQRRSFCSADGLARCVLTCVAGGRPQAGRMESSRWLVVRGVSGVVASAQRGGLRGQVQGRGYARVGSPAAGVHADGERPAKPTTKDGPTPNPPCGNGKHPVNMLTFSKPGHLFR